uniref:Uncharacterized protein n=1 Tax=Globodera pallida TaxID=36090 RepID=A0A183C6E9_GLOPA
MDELLLVPFFVMIRSHFPLKPAHATNLKHGPLDGVQISDQRKRKGPKGRSMIGGTEATPGGQIAPFEIEVVEEKRTTPFCENYALKPGPGILSIACLNFMYI